MSEVTFKTLEAEHPNHGPCTVMFCRMFRPNRVDRFPGVYFVAVPMANVFALRLWEGGPVIARGVTPRAAFIAGAITILRNHGQPFSWLTRYLGWDLPQWELVEVPADIRLRLEESQPLVDMYRRYFADNRRCRCCNKACSWGDNAGYWSDPHRTVFHHAVPKGDKDADGAQKGCQQNSWLGLATLHHGCHDRHSGIHGPLHEDLLSIRAESIVEWPLARRDKREHPDYERKRKQAKAKYQQDKTVRDAGRPKCHACGRVFGKSSKPVPYGDNKYHKLRCADKGRDLAVVAPDIALARDLVQKTKVPVEVVEAILADRIAFILGQITEFNAIAARGVADLFDLPERLVILRGFGLEEVAP